MARDITSGFEAEIESELLRPGILLEAEFASGDVRAWTGIGDLVFNSETYTGLGDFINFSPVQETQKLEANGIQVSLTGIKSSLIAIALDSTEFHWRPISLFFAVFDDSGSLIADPYQIFAGRMDVIEINDDGETSSIVLNCESNLIDLKDSRERRYTPEDQKRVYPNDLGLDFTPTIQDIEITWGVTG